MSTETRPDRQRAALWRLKEDAKKEALTRAIKKLSLNHQQGAAEILRGMLEGDEEGEETDGISLRSFFP